MDKIELTEFMKKFLPDYEQKRSDFWTENAVYSNQQNEYMFIRAYHHEALAAYTDKVCEKQRGNCLRNTDHTFENILKLHHAIINAKQPKPNEL